MYVGCVSTFCGFPSSVTLFINPRYAPAANPRAATRMPSKKIPAARRNFDRRSRKAERRLRELVGSRTGCPEGDRRGALDVVPRPLLLW
jgi:hypothetical protein